MGRLVRDPEVRYGGANNTAVAHYSIAVDRRYKTEENAADFIPLVSFGKTAEFVEKYLKKGTKIVVEGELNNNNYKDKEGKMVYGFQVVTSNVEFAESKGTTSESAPSDAGDDFMKIPDNIQEALPFN